MLEDEATAERNSVSRDHCRRRALIAGEPKAPSVAVRPEARDKVLPRLDKGAALIGAG